MTPTITLIPKKITLSVCIVNKKEGFFTRLRSLFTQKSPSTMRVDFVGEYENEFLRNELFMCDNGQKYVATSKNIIVLIAEKRKRFTLPTYLISIGRAFCETQNIK